MKIARAPADEDDDAPGGGADTDNAWGGDPERLRAVLLKSAKSPLGKPMDEAYFENLRGGIRRDSR